MATFTKSFRNNKRQHTSWKLLLKVNNKVSEEINKIYRQVWARLVINWKITQLSFIALPWIQNNCSSLRFYSEFKIGFNSLVFSAFLNRRVFQFLSPSVISTLSCVKLMCTILKSNLSLFWKNEDHVERGECKYTVSNKF